MKTELKYIELKTGYSDDGPAWIGEVEFSKSGKTVYFNNRAFKGNGHGVCYDLETGEEYWISSVKKNEQNRHWAGHGKVKIDRKSLNLYLSVIGKTALDMRVYELVDVQPTDKNRFYQFENIEGINLLKETYDLNGISKEELINLIDRLRREESHASSKNEKKSVTICRVEAERLLSLLTER